MILGHPLSEIRHDAAFHSDPVNNSAAAKSVSLTDKFALAVSCRGANVKAYGQAVSHVFLSPADALAHYLQSGRNAAPDLFPFIDPNYYARNVGEQIPVSMTPLEHYLTVGAKADISPMPLFDPKFVRSQAEQVPLENIFEFLSNPGFASVDPHPLFSKRYYNSVNPGVAKAGIDPFVHFVLHGWRERRAIHPFFRDAEYRRFEFPEECSVEEFDARMASALASAGLAQKQPLFDTSYYLSQVDSVEARAAPLQHYLTVGWRQNASAFPLFDQTFFLAQAPQIRPGISPYVEYLSDSSYIHGPSQFFEPEFYQQFVGPGYRASSLEHFIRFGAAEGVRPHPLAVVTNAYPSRYSGFEAVRSFCDAGGRQLWVCTPKTDGDLVSQLREMSEIEPALGGPLECYGLHPYSGPVGKYDLLLTDLTRKCARCNCLVISNDRLEDGLISRLCSVPISLTTAARPWLTLLSCSPSTIRYWHLHYRQRADAPFSLAGTVSNRVRVVARACAASIPNKLVLKTDALGVALLREYGRQLLATIPEVTLLVDGQQLTPGEQQWLSEYVSMNYSEFCCLIILRDVSPSLIPNGQGGLGLDVPRTIGL
jgi:hypothetical protein